MLTASASVLPGPLPFDDYNVEALQVTYHYS